MIELHIVLGRLVHHDSDGAVPDQTAGSARVAPPHLSCPSQDGQCLTRHVVHFHSVPTLPLKNKTLWDWQGPHTGTGSPALAPGL